MICVVATIELQPGTRHDFLTCFNDNLPNVLAEEGCLEYTPAIDTPTDIKAQGEIRDNVVTVVEKWRDLAALQAHLEAPHMLTYRQAVQSMVVGASLQILEPILLYSPIHGWYCLP